MYGKSVKTLLKTFEVEEVIPSTVSKREVLNIPTNIKLIIKAFEHSSAEASSSDYF